MLEVVFDRLVRILTTSLRNFTSDNVEVSIDRLNSLRFGDYLENVSGQSMFAVFKAEEWDNYGILILSSSLVYSIIDALLGGHDRVRSAVASEGRPEGRHHTAIERALIEPLIRVILSDLSMSFSPLCAVNFRLDRLELNSRFATISRATNGVVMARFGIDMDGRGGDVDLILPHATLEPVREILLQQFMGEKFGHDGIWESHLAQELWNTDVTLDAVLEEQTMNLQDILTLSPGTGSCCAATRHPLCRCDVAARRFSEDALGKSRDMWLSVSKKILLGERPLNGPPPIAEKTERFHGQVPAWA